MTNALILLLLLAATPANEVEWCRHLAPKYGAEVEVRLDDGTRCDLVTETEAIECDWAKNGKWAEAIGQSLYYAIELEKKPAIILLVKDPKRDQRYVDRCRKVCDRYGIRLYVERTR